MVADSVAGVLDGLRSAQLLSPDQWALLEATNSVRANGRTLCKQLQQRGWLTAYQANELLKGRSGRLRIGRYRILDLLGEGGFGKVFKARHDRLNRLVAIKVLHSTSAMDAEMLGRFHREIQALGRLSHPNVIHAFDSGLVDGAPFLVMEYAEGPTLAQVVTESGPLQIADACELAAQAAAGLQCLHEHGLVHRDVKPANLLLLRHERELPAAGDNHTSRNSVAGTSRNGGPSRRQIKLLDLGLAAIRHASALTDENTPLTRDGSPGLGTADYQSPEQALDFRSSDIRGDIYSLGCTLVFLLTGQPPFPGATLAERLLKHQQAPPPRLADRRADVPAELDYVVRRMLAKNSSDRYQTPAEVMEALGPWSKAASGNSAITWLNARNGGNGPSRSRHYVIALGLIGMVMAASVGALALMRQDKPIADESKPVPIVAAQLETGMCLDLRCGQGEKEFQVKRPGYDCQLIRGERRQKDPKDAKTHFWQSKDDALAFQVLLPPHTRARLRLSFRHSSGNHLMRQQVLIHGKPRGEVVGRFRDTPRELEVVLERSDTASGQVTVEIRSIADRALAATVSRIELETVPE